MSPAGRESVLHTFEGGKADGASPGGSIALDQAGNIYGVTESGGTYNQGVVYKLTPSGQETILHAFTSRADGGFPTGIALDSAGNLYGTAEFGGEGSQTGLQEGVVFKVDAAGSFSLLHSFTGLSDGGNPDGGVVLDQAGNLYGTTNSGGFGDPGAGVVFKIDTSGSYSVLHAFSAATEGGHPYAGVTLDAAGNLYGTCSGDGPRSGGTVFELDAAGNFSVLYAFLGGVFAGFPFAGVVRDAAGNLYGTVSAAAEGCPGTHGACGVVYRIDTLGDESVLYSFTGSGDGANPWSPVALDETGHIYGTAVGLLPGTPVGGGGVAFKIALP
jgi:uncharacterized repeat protein (TIGR03803 family)